VKTLRFVIAAGLVLGACGDGGAEDVVTGPTPDETSSLGEPEGRAPLPPPDDGPIGGGAWSGTGLTLYVSNQSFDDPSVDITVTIDGRVVVDEEFDVEGQHNWKTFELDLGPGEHTLRAESSTGAVHEAVFVLPEGEPRWAVLDNWWYPEEGERHFTFSIHDEPVGFA
jgi:hypothetical protein